MISFSTVELEGHTYDADLLAAPLRLLQARAAGPGRRPSRLALIERALSLRTQGLHARIGSGSGLCSCGLVLSGNEPIEDVDGHLDLGSWLPAYTLVVKSTHDAQPYVAVCRCGWRQRYSSPSAAQDGARDHASEAASLSAPAERIRLRDRSPVDVAARTSRPRHHSATGSG